MTLRMAENLKMDDRVNCFVSGWIAYDPETGAYIKRDDGNYRAGRPHKYIYCEIGKPPYPLYALTEKDAYKQIVKQVGHG